MAILIRQTNAPADVSALIIADPSISDDQVFEFAKLPRSEAEKKLEAVGFHILRKGKSEFFFAPKLWQGEQLKSILARYQKLAQAFHGDGRVDLSKDPAVLDFARHLMGQMNENIESDTAMAAVPRRTLEMKVGDRTISMVVQPPPDRSLRSWLDGHPASEGAPGAWKDKDDDSIKWPASFHYRGLGALQRDPIASLDLFRTGLDLLNTHFRQVREALEDGYDGMIDKAFSAFRSNLGKSFDGLDNQTRDLLDSEMNQHFADFGFTSATEGASFLHSAVLGDYRTSIMLGVCSGPGQYVMHQLP